MNKEEIIIDGVDVSGCEKAKYIKQKKIVLCATGGFCEICPNCYYKQIKRLKEENVKLLFAKGTLIEFCNKLTKIIDEKKENENKILQILSEIKQLVSTDYIKNKKQLVQNYDYLDNFMQKIEDKCNEVKQ